MAFPDDFPNLLPTARELEQLWRRADNTYKSCWSCPNDHDHTDDKSSPCPQCGKPRQKLVKTTSIKDALQRKSQSPEFFDALKHGPSLYKSFKDQEPNDDTPFWSFWHGDGVRRLEEKGCDLTITDNYLPIVVGLFIDGWKPCGNDYSIASITLRVYNLPGKMATKKTCLIPLCHVDGPGKWKRPMLHLSPVVDELLRLGVDGFRVRWTKHHPPCRVQGQTRHHQLPNFAHRSLFQRRQEPTASAASKICTYLDTRGLEPVGVWMQSGGSGSEGKLLRRHKLTPTHICCDGVWLDDVKIQPAKRQTRTDNSCVLFREGCSTPYLGIVKGIYLIQGSPDGTFLSSDQHRWTELYLHVLRVPISQLDAAAKNAGLHLYDMYSCDPRGQVTDALVPIENVVEQVFLGIDPRRGHEGELHSVCASP